MKRYISILALLIFISCNNLFHEEDNEFIVIDKQQEKIDLLNGVYSLLVKVHDGEYFKALCRSDDVNIYLSYSFNYVLADNYRVSCSYSGGGTLDFSEVSGNIYNRLYTAVVTLNSMLAQVSANEEPELTGEIYFLRSYCYFKLARLFGTPPLIDDTDVSFLVPKPSYTEVYEFIEEDLLNSLELLPETYSGARIPGETPHKGTAKALLAELYLSWAGFPLNDQSKYAEAAKYSGEVIQQAEYYNFGLLDDFADLWKAESRHNKEDIFGLFFNSDDSGTKNAINRLYISGYHRIGFNGYSYTFPNIKCTYKPEFKFFNSFPNNYRKYNSLITGSYDSRFYSEPDTTVGSFMFQAFDPVVNPCDFLNDVAYLKWFDFKAYDFNTRSWVEGMDITLYLLRYAQTLLTYAEASARSGKLDALAYEAVNKVRRRANKLPPDVPSKYDLTPTLTTEQFLDSVVWERAWELCLEPEGRWFDIIRLDLKDKLADYRDKKEKSNTIPDVLLTDDWYFFLIPQEDRWVNPNFK